MKVMAHGRRRGRCGHHWQWGAWRLHLAAHLTVEMAQLMMVIVRRLLLLLLLGQVKRFKRAIIVVGVVIIIII